MMKSLIPAALIAASLTAAPALAANADSTAVEGSYLLVQTNDSQRVLALNPGGVASLISQGQQVRGYTSGLGSWQMTGPDTVRADIIDFNALDEQGDGEGTTHSVFELTFSGLVDGKFSNVTGAFSGKAFAKGQNPLTDNAQPVRTFGTEFQGTRIGFDVSTADYQQDDETLMVIV